MSIYTKIRGSFIAGLLKKIFRLEVIGSENEPASGAYIVCSNHSSNYDPIVTALGIKRQIFYMAKQELFKIPILKSIVKAFGAYPVDRKRADVSSIKNTLAILEKGDIIGIYPQGKRAKGIPPDKIDKRKLQRGFAMMAIRAGVGVLPMTIITPKNKVRLFGRTKIVLGKYISAEEIAANENNGSNENETGKPANRQKITELTDKVFGEIINNYEKYKF